MGILLGLLTALTWGGADFVARFATHRIGALRSMLYMQLTGFLLLSSILQAFGSWGHLADGSGWQPGLGVFWPGASMPCRDWRFTARLRLEKCPWWLPSRPVIRR